MNITDHETGEIACSGCGMILGQHVDHRVKRSKHHFESLSSKAGLRFSDMGISGKVGTKKHDYSGKKIPIHIHAKIKRLASLDSRTKISLTSNRNLSTGLVLIQTLSEKLALSTAATEKAAHIFRKSHDLSLSRGRSVRQLAAASIYAACRINKIPRNLTEISKLGNIRRTTLARMYRVIYSTLEIKTNPYEPEMFLSKFANRLAINEKTERKAIHIVREAKKRQVLFGKRPSSIATASLYIASKHDHLGIGLRKFSAVSKNSVNTLRKLVKELEEVITHESNG